MEINQISTYSEAIDFINQNSGLSISELTQISSQMNTKIDGAQSLLLYSGNLNPVDQNLQSWKIAEFIGSQSNSKVATIGQTDVASLLKSDIYVNSIVSNFGELDDPVAIQQARLRTH